MRFPVQYSIIRAVVPGVLITVFIFVVCGGIVSASVPSSVFTPPDGVTSIPMWLSGHGAPLTDEGDILSGHGDGHHISPECKHLFTYIIHPFLIQISAYGDRFRQPSHGPLPSTNLSPMQNTSTPPVPAIVHPERTVLLLPDTRNSTRNTGQDPWIEISPIGTAQKNTIRVRGTTNLPEGESIGVAAMTTMFHPSPKNYDYSHEIAETNATVQGTNTPIRQFSCTIDASLLTPGEYCIEVWPRNERYNIETTQIFNLMPKPAPSPYHIDTIEPEQQGLPSLTVNHSMEPFLLTHNIILMPPEDCTHRHEIPYGAVMVLSADGVHRLFDSQGTQIDAFYDAHALHFTEVPNGAMVRHGDSNTTVYVGEERIFTKISATDSIQGEGPATGPAPA